MHDKSSASIAPCLMCLPLHIYLLLSRHFFSTVVTILPKFCLSSVFSQGCDSVVYYHAKSLANAVRLDTNVILIGFMESQLNVQSITYTKIIIVSGVVDEPAKPY